MKKISFSFFAPLLLIFSCAGGGNQAPQNKIDSAKTRSQSETQLDKGKCIDKIQCSSYPEQSFALYLPSNYSSNKKYPVIFFFDSHADGKLPVSRYSSIAEKYSFILAASNNSQNGMSSNESVTIGVNMVEEVRARFSIDDQGIYLSGFSGGSRVASMISSVVKTKGIIGCSAGMQLNQGSAIPFYYAGIAGSCDMNLSEMRNLHFQLDANSSKNIFLVFNGKHEWPTMETMEKAVLWMHFRAMADQMIPIDSKCIQAYEKQMQDQVANDKRKGDLLSAYKSLSEYISFLEGLKDVTVPKSEIESIAKHPKVLVELKRESDLFKEESILKDNFLQSLEEKSLSWWQNKINELRIPFKNDSLRTCLNTRLLGYLGLVIYSYSNSALRDSNLERAKKYISIYKFLEPENSETDYFFARLMAKTEDKDMVIKSLNSASTNGFRDLKRFDGESDFAKYKNEKWFQDFRSTLTK